MLNYDAADAAKSCKAYSLPATGHELFLYAVQEKTAFLFSAISANVHIGLHKGLFESSMVHSHLHSG